VPTGPRSLQECDPPDSFDEEPFPAGKFRDTLFAEQEEGNRCLNTFVTER
jgi:hypothetical protein